MSGAKPAAEPAVEMVYFAGPADHDRGDGQRVDQDADIGIAAGSGRFLQRILKTAGAPVRDVEAEQPQARREVGPLRRILGDAGDQAAELEGDARQSTARFDRRPMSRATDPIDE